MVVLVTGGTGSLGQTLTKQLLERGDSVRVFSRNEYFQWEMKKSFPKARYLIGDIRDKDRLWRALDGVDLVIHTAALKHVSSCEYNPIEAVKTNILGSINIIETSIDRKVDKVLAVSSDKAVSPLNIYGATKLCMEKLFINANSYGGKFSVVRCGNFINSRGSVLPLFKEQSEKGEITVTDPDMKRYFIELETVSSFVLDCTQIMNGGEVFVPEMKEENILDIAKLFKCPIKITGKGEGEKLNEELMTCDERLRAVAVKGGWKC
jgi:UDP-N-acetylglucosamine 4,6-dehydratase